MKPLRQIIFILLIGLTCLLLGTAIGVYFWGNRLLQQLGIQYDVSELIENRIYRIHNTSFQFKNIRGEMDEVLLPSPLFALSEIILQQPISGGIVIENILLQAVDTPKGEKFSEANLTTKTSFSEDYSLEIMQEQVHAVIQEMIHFLNSPIFYFPRISIGQVFLSDTSFYLKGVSLENGWISLTLCDQEGKKLIYLREEIGGFKRMLEEMDRYWTRVVKLDEKRNLEGVSLSKVIPYLSGEIEFCECPISLLSGFLPPQIKPEGSISGNLVLTRGQLLGFLSLEGVQTRPLSFLGSLQRLNARVDFEKNCIQIREVDGEIGHQKFHLNGRCEHHNWHQWKAEMEFSGEDLPLIRSRNISLRGTVDLKFLAQRKEKKLSGTVRLTQGFWISDAIDPIQEWIVLQSGGEKKWSRFLPENLVLDLDVDGEDFMRIATNYFRGVLSTHLDITGTLNVPIIYGQVIARQCSIFFPFAHFHATSASLDFNPADKLPQFHVYAKSKLYDYDLRLQLTGPLLHPVLTFSSLPVLSTGEIISMITTGVSPVADNPDTTNQLGILGLYFGSHFLGEDFWDHVRIQLGQDTTENGSETMEIEYKIDERNSIIGEYDRFDDYNVDVKFRIYSK